MLARPLPGLLALSSWRDEGIEFRDYAVNGRDIPAALGAALDRIERNQAVKSRIHMRRDAQELSWRLSLSSERQYRFTARVAQANLWVCRRGRDAWDQSAYGSAPCGYRY